MLEILELSKTFANQQNALDRVSLTVQDGEFFSLLGPSGCGKSTLLKILAGLDRDHQGKIRLAGHEIQHLSAQERPFNMVFQNYALFPHLNVYDNLAFGLRIKKTPEDQIEKRVKDMLHMVNMESFKTRSSQTLSGGQKQRIALARALINQPKLLLLDEPLSALDQKMRKHMQQELRLLQKSLGMIFIFVTHDQEEAFIMSDRVAVMNHGKLVQVSEPQLLYEKPESLFVANFVGELTEIPVKDLKCITTGKYEFHFAGTKLTSQRCSSCEGAKPQAFIRPEHIELVTSPSGNPQDNHLPATIKQLWFRGHFHEISVEAEAGVLLKISIPLRAGGGQTYQVGQQVRLKIPAQDLMLFIPAGLT